MIAVIKKELKSYFLSPIGYIVIGIFLLAFSIFFNATSLSTGSVDLGAIYYYTALYGLIIIVPLLSMKMFSEERKLGTEQLLLTSPISVIKIVLGKLISAMIVVAITLVFSLMYFAITSHFGKPNFKAILTAMFGFILISTAEISFGMFISSLTENQIISAIITAAFLLLPLFTGITSGILSNIILIQFYLNFALGIISIENIISLVLFAFVFISLTVIVMQRRKLVK